MKENRLVVISPFYNAGNFVDKNINSIRSQKYGNFVHIITNDCSTDNSDEVIKSMIEFGEPETIGDSQVYRGDGVIYVKNNKREGALYNIVFALKNFTEPEDIICSVDGDDWLLKKTVLTYINETFEEKGILFMYGGSSWTDGRSCCSREYDEHSFKNIRNGLQFYLISQMRCFKKKVFDEMLKQDENLDSLRDSNGEFYKMAHDVAFYFPVCEIVGFDKIYHNKMPIYTYNRDNPINDDKVSQSLQTGIHREILKKKPFISTEF